MEKSIVNAAIAIGRWGCLNPVNEVMKLPARVAGKLLCVLTTGGTPDEGIYHIVDPSPKVKTTGGNIFEFISLYEYESFQHL